MTQISLAMPTAVTTESSENTMSISMICPMTAPMLAFAFLAFGSSSPPIFSVFSNTSLLLLKIKKTPPTSKMRSRPDISCLKTVKSGCSSFMTHDKVNSSPSRLIKAAPKPSRYANWRFASGKRCTMMAMKTMLSMPSTISSPASATRLMRIVGSVSCCSTPGQLALDQALVKSMPR